MRVIASRMTFTTEVKDEQRFSRSSLFVVLFSLALLLTATAFKIYRLSFPTEGWSLSIDYRVGLSFDQNLLGVSSPFQKGDVLLEAAGVNMQFGFDTDTSSAKASYQAGNPVLYKVQRGFITGQLRESLMHFGKSCWGGFFSSTSSSSLGLSSQALSFSSDPAAVPLSFYC
jgi:hypothetical protein